MSVSVTEQVFGMTCERCKKKGWKGGFRDEEDDTETADSESISSTVDDGEEDAEGEDEPTEDEGTHTTQPVYLVADPPQWISPSPPRRH